MGEHRHEWTCWDNYDPCGEHHTHDYNCGGGQLSSGCPEHRPPAPTLQDELDAAIARAERAEAAAERVLKTGGAWLGDMTEQAAENTEASDFMSAMESLRATIDRRGADVL